MKLLLLGLAMIASAANLPDFDKLWDYEKPAETEAKFRELLPAAEKSGNAEYHLQLLTQLARTQSLQKKFPEAHQILDQVEKKLTEHTPMAEVRYHLERGRSFNSDGKLPEAIAEFQNAYEHSLKHHFDLYAVDALHMLAIADKAKAMDWNLKALALAEKSKDPKAQKWKGSLYNNIGWTYHDAGKFEEALDMFKKAQAFRVETKDAARIGEAKWMVARALRSLKRYDEALKIQLALEQENEKSGKPDGYVFEEIAEILLVTGQEAESKPYFGKAYDLLSKDIWLKDSEPARIERLKKLSAS